MDARALRIAVYYALGAAVPAALLFYIMGRWMTLATPMFIVGGGMLVGYRAYKIEVRAKERRRMLAEQALDDAEAIGATPQKAA